MLLHVVLFCALCPWLGRIAVTQSVRTQCIIAQSYNNSPFERAFAKQVAAMKCLYTTTLRFAKRFARNAAAPVIIRPRLGGRAHTGRSAVTQTRKCDLPPTSDVIKVLHLLHSACSPSFSPPPSPLPVCLSKYLS